MKCGSLVLFYARYCSVPVTIRKCPVICASGAASQPFPQESALRKPSRLKRDGDACGYNCREDALRTGRGEVWRCGR